MGNILQQELVSFNVSDGQLNVLSTVDGKVEMLWGPTADQVNGVYYVAVISQITGLAYIYGIDVNDYSIVTQIPFDGGAGVTALSWL